MDARTLLNQVSDAYRKLRSLTADATLVRESGDDDSNQRSQQRVRFFYSAPDRVRFESLGDRGVVQVCDGTHTDTVFPRMGPGQRSRYSRMPANRQRLPHDFQPQLPFGGGNEPFLFAHINERVTEAELLPDENGHRVISVTYEPGPHAGFSTKPLRFRVDPASFCIMRVAADLGHRFPTHDEITWTRNTLNIRHLHIDEPIPDSTFAFTPPADAAELPQGHGVRGSFGGGGGFIRGSATGLDRFEHQGSHEWQGETLIEHSRWNLRGVLLKFERRMTFSEGNKHVDIVEHATGPQGNAEATYALDWT